MITCEYVHDKVVFNNGSCNSCGKTVAEDPNMVRITVTMPLAQVFGRGNSICLCSNCLSELKRELSNK